MRSLSCHEAENAAIFEGYEDLCLVIHGCASLDYGSRKLLPPKLRTVFDADSRQKRICYAF